MLALLARRAAPAIRRPAVRAFSDSLGGGGITYSGGHASQGQGGFYSSGGARANKENEVEQRTGAVAQMEDVKVLRAVMAEVSELEEQLSTEDDPVSVRSIELSPRSEAHHRQGNRHVAEDQIRGRPCGAQRPGAGTGRGSAIEDAQLLKSLPFEFAEKSARGPERGARVTDHPALASPAPVSESARASAVCAVGRPTRLVFYSRVLHAARAHTYYQCLRSMDGSSVAIHSDIAMGLAICVVLQPITP